MNIGLDVLERRKKVRGMGGNYNSTGEEGDKKEE